MQIELNLDYANAARLILPPTGPVNLVLIGCGGTGSWLAPNVARVARLLIEKFRREPRVTFVDPDIVEAKNIYRQNFCDAEVGQNKAITLAYRFGLAWGIPIAALPERFSPDRLRTSFSDFTILIGCVDNAAARQAIREAVTSRPRVWWLDCGNAKSNGQVLLGTGTGEPKDPFELPGFCSWLPLPTTRHPELLEALPEEHVEAAPMSCADMAMADSQGLAINQAVAAEAGDYLFRMLLTHDLRKCATYMDLASGSARSEYIVPSVVSLRDTVSTETVIA